MGVFGRDAGTGRLTFLDAADNGLGSVPSDVGISPDGEHLYAVLSDSLAVLDRDAGTGALTVLEVEQDGIAGGTIFVGQE